MKSRVLLILLLISAFVSCKRKNGDIIQAPGVINAEVITLKTLVSGTVDELTVTEGEKITYGKMIVKINSEKLENALEEIEINFRDLILNQERLEQKRALLEANREFLKKQLQRFERLKKNAAVSGESYEKIHLQYQEAETDLFDNRKAKSYQNDRVSESFSILWSHSGSK